SKVKQEVEQLKQNHQGYTTFIQKISQLVDNFEVHELKQFLKDCQTEALEIPPSEEMEALYELAMLGSMRKIREKANFLEELDPKYTPFAQKLKTLAQEFRDEEIITWIEQYL
ncbi:MAG: hypothetical protein SWJ54_22865, partial [Cyanobacteriota bacterium]|nr:hypothetical protein [Cyanobacteriota bacterium]